MAAWSGQLSLSICLQRDGGWLRVNRYVLWYTSQPPKFSERLGYVTPFLRLGKWRFIWKKDLPRNC